MSSPTHVETHKPVPIWHEVLAAVLDFFFIMLVASYAIDYLTGNVTEQDFHLKGGPASQLFAIIILYFVVFRRYLGGTLFQRLLGAP